jgi:hypothetical protein
MSGRDRYRHVEAFVEQDQIEWNANGLRQLVTVMMTGEDEALEVAACQLTARRARDLAFQLLVEAEHAERLTDTSEEDEQ